MRDRTGERLRGGLIGPVRDLVRQCQALANAGPGDGAGVSVGRLRLASPSCRDLLAAFMLMAAIAPALAGSRTDATGEAGAMACSVESISDTIASASVPEGIVLAVGGKVKLAGIRLPQDEPFREKALAHLRARAGAPVMLQWAGSADRWGRRAVRLMAGGSGTGVDLARELVDAGLALADPASQGAACGRDYLAGEDAARQQSLGIWADAGYKPIGVDQAAKLQTRAGDFAIVEGRVRSVGERAQATYLNFGEHWARDFTVIIPRRVWRRMADRHMGTGAFKGRNIRVRGILEAWQGGVITVEIPDMIELLPR